MKKWTVLVALAFIGLAGCGPLAELFDGERSIPLSEVPAPALEAARAAVEGIVLTEAEVEEEDGQLVSEIEGRANGIEYEIEVTAEGEVLEIEKEGEEDEEDDD